jgi:hypothetical protein
MNPCLAATEHSIPIHEPLGLSLDVAAAARHFEFMKHRSGFIFNYVEPGEKLLPLACFGFITMVALVITLMAH